MMRIGVLGSDQDGRNIAQLFAQKGYEVVQCRTASAQWENRHQQLPVTGANPAVRPTTELNLTSLADCDLVIETIASGESQQLELYRLLDEQLKPDAVLAAHASPLPITSLAAATTRPDRVIGIDFMLQVAETRLLAVNRGLPTSEATFRCIAEAAANLDRQLTVSVDYPGFIVSRLLIPAINEAIRALSDGVGSAEDIDQGVQLLAEQPMGPLSLADFIGLDTVLAMLKDLYQSFREARYRPCPLLEQMVRVGYLGRKSGLGFFAYGKNQLLWA